MSAFTDRLKRGVLNFANKYHSYPEAAVGGLLRGASDIVFSPANLFLPKDKEIHIDPYGGSGFFTGGMPLTKPTTRGEKITESVAEFMPGVVVGGEIAKPFLGGFQKPLYQTGSKLLQRGGFANKILGSGAIAAGQGLPYSIAANAMKTMKTGEAATPGESAFDIAFDMGTATLPFLGIGASVLSKSGLDEPIESASREALEKALKNLDIKFSQSTDPIVKSNILKEKKAIMDAIDPSRITKSADEIAAIRNVQDVTNQRNIARREISAKETRLVQLEKDIFSAKKNAKGKMYKGQEWQNVENLLNQKAKLEEALELDKQRFESIGKATPKTTEDILSGKPKKEVITPPPEVPESKVIGQEKSYLDNLINRLDESGADNSRVFSEYELGRNKNSDVGKSIKEWTDDLKDYYKKTTGKDIPEAENYIPRIKVGGKEDVIDVVGTDITDLYDPATPRTGEVPLGDRSRFYNDPAEIDKIYKKAADRKAVMASSPEGKMMKDIGEAVEKVEGAKKPSELRPFNELKKSAEKAGKEVDIVDVPRTLKQKDITIFGDARNLERLNMYEVFEPIMNWRNRSAYVQHQILDKFEGNLADNYQLVFDEISKIFPESDVYDMMPKIDRIVRRIGQTGGDPTDFLKKVIDKTFKKHSYQNFFDEIVKYNFSGLDEDYINGLITQTLGQDFLSKSIVDKVFAKWRKTIYSGLLGLNVRSMLLNPLELKRLFATSDAKTAMYGIKEATKDFKFRGTEEIFQRYPQFANVNIAREKILQNPEMKNTLEVLSGKHDALLDATLYPFMKTEDFKNVAFLYAYEKEAMEKGLKGSQVADYVSKKFRKYSLNSEIWNQPGLYKNEAAKTIFQLGQYSLKELGVFADEFYLAGKGVKELIGGGSMTDAEKKAAKYLYKWFLGSAATAGLMSWAIGANPADFFLQIPGLRVQKDVADYDRNNVFGSNYEVEYSPAPILQQGLSLANAVVDYMNGADEEGDRISKYHKRDLGKKGAWMLPAGNQLINKTGRYAMAESRGYTKELGGDVKFPVPTNPVDKARGFMFGEYSTKPAREHFDTVEQIVNKEGRDMAWKAGMSERESDVYRMLFEEEGLEPAVQFYNDVMTGRVADDGTDIKKILKGVDREYTKSQIAEGKAVDVLPSDILIQDRMEEQKWGEIRDYFDELVDGGLEPNQVRKYMGIKLQEYGMTYDDFEIHQYSSGEVKTEQKAKWIVNTKRTDFVNLYKEGVITLAVCKEMERLGYIGDAQDFWDKLKMTDPYLRRKAQEKAMASASKKAQSAIKSYNKKVASLLGGAAKNRGKGVARIQNVSVTKPTKPKKPSKIKAETATVRSIIGKMKKQTVNIPESYKSSDLPIK